MSTAWQDPKLFDDATIETAKDLDNRINEIIAVLAKKRLKGKTLKGIPRIFADTDQFLKTK